MMVVSALPSAITHVELTNIAHVYALFMIALALAAHIAAGCSLSKGGTVCRGEILRIP